MSTIYGIDTTKPFTPQQVQEAIVECFTRAHSQVLEQEMGRLTNELPTSEIEKLKKINVRLLIKKYFQEVGGDYETPTRQALIAVCNKLAEFARHFRSEEIISKHYGEIMRLIDKMTE